MYWAHSGSPTWVAHLGPISASRTLCFGSEVGYPGGAHKAVQMGPTWDPYRIPVGEDIRDFFPCIIILSIYRAGHNIMTFVILHYDTYVSVKT